MRTTGEIERAFEQLELLTDALYSEEGVGGPLHVITDDGNIRDSDLVSCYRDVCSEATPMFVRTVCLGILHLLAMLTEAQRLIWYLRVAIREEGFDPFEIATLVRAWNGQIVNGPEGVYDDKVVSPDGSQVLWEGLAQVRTRKASKG
jgi:hypothetical protein